MIDYYDDGRVRLIHGHACVDLAHLPDRSVQCIVTSPPYYGLRDYGDERQIGGEQSPAEYVAALVEVFREARRVLTDDGVLWLNLGDSYYSGRGNPGPNAADPKNAARRGWTRSVDRPGQPWGRQKGLLMVPARVAIALQDDGWILRSEIVWAKPNPMPESVEDRPTRSHEMIYLLTKSPRYYYDAAAIAEPYTGDRDPSRRARTGAVNKENSIARPWSADEDDRRNKRDVWTVPTVPFPGAHFAVYPPELIRPCILAGSRPGDTVLDPFSGSGTTGWVATHEGRKYIGIDTNADYLDLSLRERFAAAPLDFGSLA